MPKLLIVILLLSVLCLSIHAQELQRLSEPDIMGTARFIGLGGAMTAVGGDPSAIHVNPASVAIYRRYESAITLGGHFDRTFQTNGPVEPTVGHFYMPEAAFVFAFGNDARRKGLIYSNFSFCYNRVATYRRNTSAYFPNVDGSIAEQMATASQGIHASRLGSEGRWGDAGVGWLSLVGYDTYMIDPVGSDSSNWAPYTNWGPIRAPQIRMQESGYLDQFAFSWGANISNRWYIGLGLNIRSLRYSKVTDYVETTTSAAAALRTTVSISGVGVNGTIGMMAQPVHFLRIGASFQTPSFVSTTERSYVDAETENVHKDGERVLFKSQSPENVRRRDLSMPLKTTVGAAFFVGRYGLISLQYDFQYWKGIRNNHVLHAGMEWVVAQCLFINAGYAYSFVQGDPAYERNIADNDVRADTEWVSLRHQHSIGAALGYRGPFGFVQVGYRYGLRKQTVYPFMTDAGETTTGHIHDIVVTLGWHTVK